MNSSAHQRHSVFLAIFTGFPVRIKRLFLHIFPISQKEVFHPGIQSVLDWISDLFMYVLDLSGIPDIATQIRLAFSPSMRLLSIDEKKIIREIYQDTVDLEAIWLDPGNRLGTNKYAHAYVLQNTINFHTRISNDILIHEIMHCLQYQRMGSIYITRSLKAQRSMEGYDYGGGQGLYNYMIGKKNFWDFNFEQQAQIIQDYYQILKGKRQSTPLEFSAYQFYLQQMREISENKGA